MTEKSKCHLCGPENPGRYDDADAGFEGALGIPLCPCCVGTGWKIGSPEFVELKKKVDGLRQSNFDLQLGPAAKELTNSEMVDEISLNNKTMVALARRAAELVEPAEGSLSLALIKNEVLR